MRIVVTVSATAVVSRNPGDGFGCADQTPWPSRASDSDQGTETHTIIVRDFDSTATQGNSLTLDSPSCHLQEEAFA